MVTNPVLCVFLLSCFTDHLSRTLFPDCPNTCDCYTAPKNGNELKSLWSTMDGISIVCQQFPSINQFDKLSQLSINTLALINLNEEHINAIISRNHNFLAGFSVNNIIFSNSLLHDDALKSVLNINKTSLNVLTFLGIEFSGLYNVWNIFSTFDKLQALHIENSTLTTLDANFARLSSENILVANFIEAKLTYIEDNVFSRWTKLRMLTISKNSIKNTYWLKSVMPQLWYLDLRRNEIAFLRNDLMVQLTKLKVLKLDFNKLMIISWETMRPLVQNLKELSFEGNLLCMNRDTSWTMKEHDVHPINGTTEYIVPEDPLFYSHSLNQFNCVWYIADEGLFDIHFGSCLEMAHNSEYEKENFRTYNGDCTDYELNLVP